LTLISRFISIPTNTLLVRGYAGTGKTTLCLELLRTFAARRRVVYISTRVSRQRLVQEYPGIDKVLAPEDVRNPDDRIPGSTFDDLRLGRSTQIVDTTLEVLHKAKNPLIVYDSWDSISNELEPSERLKLEKTLLTAIDGRNGNAVFVAEETEPTNLVFGADGVVTLSSAIEVEEDVRLRKLVIDKLRGVTIGKSVSYFTLRGGRFEEFQDFAFEIAQKPRRFRPLPDSDTHFSSGTQAVDRIFRGGFKKGSVILITMTPTTNKQYLAAVMGPPFLNFLNQGNMGLVGLSPDNDEKKILRSLQPYSDTKSLALLKILRYSRVTELIGAYDKTKSGGAKATLVELDVTFLKQEDDFQALLELCRRIKENRDLLLIVTRNSTEYMNRLRAIADLEVKTWQLGSYLLSREIITNTSLFALKFALVDGTPSYIATEVV
jgi:KaiC/GvpD/RAD55 family RecA-like ATPase